MERYLNNTRRQIPDVAQVKQQINVGLTSLTTQIHSPHFSAIKTSCRQNCDTHIMILHVFIANTGLYSHLVCTQPANKSLAEFTHFFRGPPTVSLAAKCYVQQLVTYFAIILRQKRLMKLNQTERILRKYDKIL